MRYMEMGGPAMGQWASQERWYTAQDIGTELISVTRTSPVEERVKEVYL